MKTPDWTVADPEMTVYYSQCPQGEGARASKEAGEETGGKELLLFSVWERTGKVGRASWADLEMAVCTLSLSSGMSRIDLVMGVWCCREGKNPEGWKPTQRRQLGVGLLTEAMQGLCLASDSSSGVSETSDGQLLEIQKIKKPWLIQNLLLLYSCQHFKKMYIHTEISLQD